MGAVLLSWRWAIAKTIAGWRGSRAHENDAAHSLDMYRKVFWKHAQLSMVRNTSSTSIAIACKGSDGQIAYAAVSFKAGL